MLFLAISTPRPVAPSRVVASRQQFWEWIRPLLASGEARSIYAKVGRGAVVVFDVRSNERLHQRLNEWSDIIPARFEVHPLIEPDAAKEFLRTGRTDAEADG